MSSDSYLGKRVEYSGFLKTDNVRGGWAGLWMRVDGPERERLGFDNMRDRGVKGTTDWTPFRIVLDVPESATQICFGCLLIGKGIVWVDELSITSIGPIGQGIPTTDSTAISGSAIGGAYERALAHLINGDADAYRKECHDLLTQIGKIEDSSDANLAAWVLALGPGAAADLEKGIMLAEQAVADDPNDANSLNTLGAVLFRAGQFQKAIETLNKSVELESREGNTWDWLFLAMAHHRSDSPAKARHWLDKAIQWQEQLEKGQFDAPSFARPMRPEIREELEYLTREAAQLIQPKDN